MTETLQDLAIRAHSGDEAALDGILRQGAGWIRSLCARKGYFLLGGGDIEDLVQEGLIALHEAVLTWNPDQSTFPVFAGVVVNRRLVTTLIAANRKKHMVLNGAMSLDAPAYDAGFKGHDDRVRLEAWELPDTSGLSRDPAELVAAAEEPGAGDLIRVLLDPLSPLERQVVTRVCLLGETYKAAAAALRIHEKSLDNALQRGKGKILRLAERAEGKRILSEEAASTLQRLARLAREPKTEQTDAEIRAALPVELLHPSVMGRYRTHVGTWIMPPARLLTLFPNIRDYVSGVKGPILDAYLAGKTRAEIGAMMGRTQTSVEHHLRRTVQTAARANGTVLKSDGTQLSPLQQRVDQLWRKGTTMKEIYATLAHVATKGEVDAALASLRQRVYDRDRFVQVAPEVETKRVPLVPPKRIPYLLSKAKPVLPEEYLLTLKLYMLGYSQKEIAARRGVADTCIGKNDLPEIRTRLRETRGFDFLYDYHFRERQHRIMWLEGLGWTEQTALEAVPQQHCDIVSMWLKGSSEQEIADKVGVPKTAIQGRIHHCRMILRRRPEARRRDGRQGVGGEAVRARKAAARATSHGDDLRRFRLYGHLLTEQQRSLLAMFFAGRTTTDMAEAMGLEANKTTRARMWSQMSRAREQLTALERRSADGKVAS